MDYKAMAKTVYDFLNHVENVDPYVENKGKVDRFIRGVIMAYSHDVRRTGSAGERSQLNDLEQAYKAYKNDASIINFYNMVQAYHTITFYNPCVTFLWAVIAIYERDHNR